MDTILRTKWSNMRQALIEGNVEAASSYFSEEKRALYMEFLQLIPNNKVNDLIPSLDRMHWIGDNTNGARYVASIDIIVNGEQMTISSYIDFELDGDGIWRISTF